MTKAYEKIAAGLEDAIAHAKGDTSRGVTHTFVDGKRVPAPAANSTGGENSEHGDDRRG